MDALLQGEKRQRISPENAIPEFKQALANTDDINTVKEAVKQMCAIIENQIKHSLGDANYDRVVEYIGTMRDELISFEEPDLYNDFVRELKRKLLDDELGEDRRELWWLIRKKRIGLIDDKLVEISKVTEQEAKEVCIHPIPPAYFLLQTNVCSQIVLVIKVKIAERYCISSCWWVCRLYVDGQAFGKVN